MQAYIAFINWLFSLGANFKVSGSVALNHYGLISRMPNDIDIVMDVNRPENQIAIMLFNLLFQEIELGDYNEDAEAFENNTLTKPFRRYFIANEKLKGMCIFHQGNLNNDSNTIFLEKGEVIRQKALWAKHSSNEKHQEDTAEMLSNLV